DRVVDVHHRVDVRPRRGHGRGHGGGGLVAAGGAQYHGDAAVQQDVHAPPQLAVAVGASDVLFEAVPFREQVSHGRHVDRTHGAGSSPLSATRQGVCADPGFAERSADPDGLVQRAPGTAGRPGQAAAFATWESAPPVGREAVGHTYGWYLPHRRSFARTVVLSDDISVTRNTRQAAM